MNVLRSCFFALALFPILGCSTVRDDARARAANEFGCDSDQISVEAMGADGYRASGCGREAVFVCSRPKTTRINPAYIGDLTTCVREGEIVHDGPPPAVVAAVPSRSGFDRGAARAAVSRTLVAADDACRERKGPHGESDMRITFAPTGEVGSISLDERFDGSDVAACLVSRMRAVRIAPFAGDAETLSIHFVVLGPRS